jgi:hypothetical protein
MTQQSHTGPPDLHTRLSEIDARLREIQSDLAPDREPMRTRVVRDPEPPAPPTVAAPAALAGPQAKLLSSMRELLDAYGLLLAQSHSPPQPTPVGLSAGPFATRDAVRAFEQALVALPGVSDVALRGYDVDNRVVFDVHVSGGSA